MQTPALIKPATPDITPGPMPAPLEIPQPIQDLANAIIEQGGGTIIITQEEIAQNDTTTIIHTSDERNHQNESENHETQTQSNPPRASPIIDKIFYIFLVAAFLVLLLQCRTRQ